MGTSIVTFYQTKVKKEWKQAFWYAIAIGLLVHLYKFSNTLWNHDSVLNAHTDQNILSSGRWFLSIACAPSSYFDLPWVTGILSLLYIALTVVVVVALFHVNNPYLIAVMAGLVAAFPGTTETFFFQFTADGYMLAMLLSALAALVIPIEEKRLWRYLLSACLICLTCGIYQSYTSFTLVLLLCYFVYQVLNREYALRDLWKWVRNVVITFACGLTAYFVIWKVAMAVQHVRPSGYQGIDSVGFEIQTLVHGAKQSVEDIIRFFLEGNIFQQGLHLYGVLNLLMLAALAVLLVAAILHSRNYRRKGTLLLIVLAIVMLVPAACMWNFVSDTVNYRPMMLQCLCVIYLFTAVMANRWCTGKTVACMTVLMSLIVFNFGLMANIGYFYMHRSYELSYATGTEMMIRIHELDDTEDFDSIAIVGDRYADVSLAGTEPSNRDLLLTRWLETDLIYRHLNGTAFLNEVFNLDLEPVSEQKAKELESDAEVKRMGIWPASDSVSVVEGTVVIKVAETLEGEN